MKKLVVSIIAKIFYIIGLFISTIIALIILSGCTLIINWRTILNVDGLITVLLGMIFIHTAIVAHRMDTSIKEES